MCLRTSFLPSCTLTHPANVAKPEPYLTLMSICSHFRQHLNDFCSPDATRAVEPDRELFAHFAPDCVYYNELEIADGVRRCEWCYEGQDVEEFQQYGDALTREWVDICDDEKGLLGEEVKIWDGYDAEEGGKGKWESVKEALRATEEEKGAEKSKERPSGGKGDQMDFEFTMALRPRKKSVNYKV